LNSYFPHEIPSRHAKVMTAFWHFVSTVEDNLRRD